MAVRKPRLPPRQLLILLVVFTLGLAGALVWVGSRLVRQDRDLERQRAREHLERAAGRVAAELEARLVRVAAGLEGAASLSPVDRDAALARWADSLRPGALLITLSEEGVRAYPAERLLFVPPRVTLTEAFDPAFQAGERLEFQGHDLAGAARAYEALARSKDSSTRAGALLRLARVQRKTGELRRALETYSRLADYKTSVLEDRPADLVARFARVDLLQQVGRHDQAEAEARTLHDDLHHGSRRLSRGSFEFYDAELRRRLGNSAEDGLATSGALALSRGVDSLWREAAAGVAQGRSERRLLFLDGTALHLIVATQGTHRVAWLATSRHLADAWLPELEPTLAREGIWLALIGAGGDPILSQLPPGTRTGFVRGTEETRLPWVITLASRDPSRLAGDLAARRRVLLSGLLVASLLGLVGTYAVARAVNRELQVARVQSDFVAAVSHEFRTPLTSIRQLSELLASDRVPGEERRHAYYELLRRESLRLHRLVESLLDFGRMEAGAREFRLEPLEAMGLVRDVIREFEEEKPGRDRPVALVACAEPCPVRADREALGLALWNLLDNATKYSPEDRPVTVSVTCANGRVGISVRDQGPGIASEEQNKVFEKFIRGRQARESGVRGTGLGLAMVRQITRAHGGEVTLRSAPRQGSTFTLSLPVAEPAA